MMFSRITWTEFFVFAGIISILYYASIGWLSFGKNIFALIGGESLKQTSNTMENSNELMPLVHEHVNELGSTIKQ